MSTGSSQLVNATSISIGAPPMAIYMFIFRMRFSSSSHRS